MISQFNRTVDTEVWTKDEFFRSLSLEMKAMYFYIFCRADLAGFWFPNWSLVEFEAGPGCPSLAAVKDALAPLFQFWKDRWQFRGFFAWQYPEGPAAKSPNGLGLRAYRSDLRRHARELGAGADLYQIAFEGNAAKQVFYERAFFSKTYSTIPLPFRGTTPPSPTPLPGGTVKTPPLTESLDQRPSNKPDVQKLTGGGGGAGEAGDVLADVHWAVLVEIFREKGRAVLEDAPFMRRACSYAQESVGQALFAQAARVFLEDPGNANKTARDFLNRVDTWVLAAKSKARQKGCEHVWTDFDEPTDSNFPNGERQKGRRCRCGRREDVRTVKGACAHERAGKSALVTIQTPVWSEFAPGHQEFVDQVKCTLCGDVVELPAGLPREAA